MDTDRLERSSMMLRAMIAGASCEQIATDFRLTKSAVSQQIRNLANDLQQVVGVVGVDEDESPTALLIRQHGAAYLEALDHYVPQAATAWRAKAIDDATRQFGSCIAKIVRHSRCAERDTALLLILFSTAAKPLEIAQLEVRDYLDDQGTVRSVSTLRAGVAVNGKERPLLFDNPLLVAALDAYLERRRKEQMGVHAAPSFRCLDPQSRLFLSRAGQPLAVKPYRTGQHHLVCKEIHEIYRRIFSYVGLTGINTALARRLAALRLLQDGANQEEIGRALGVKRLAVSKMLQAVEDSFWATLRCGPSHAKPVQSHEAAEARRTA